MTRFLLVRHGQSEWNAVGRWQGQGDPPLSARGREEAEMAASALADARVLVFASPLLRARETAEIVSSHISDGSVRIERGLMEIDVGDFSGLTNAEIEEQMPDAWAALRAGELKAFPGGEARADFRARLLETLSSLAARHPDDDILAVTHGGAIGDLERYLEVHPGHGVGNLVGRWFRWDDGLSVDSDRIALADQPG